MKLFTDFLDKKQMMQKTKVVGFIAALSALFMAATPPEVTTAQEALASIQLFWLVILTLSVTSLFIDFMLFLWDREKDSVGDPDLPYNIALMVAVGGVLVTLVTYMWQYVFTAYADALGSYIALIGLPTGIFLVCSILAMLLKKKEAATPLILKLATDSLIITLIVGVSGVYLMEAFLGYFYLLWIYWITPGVFVGFLLLGVIMAYRRGENFLKP